MALTDPALVLVVRLAGHCVFGALVPLATAWLLLLVTEHSLENELVVGRELDGVLHVHLVEVGVALNPHFDSIHHVSDSTSRSEHAFYYSCDPRVSLYILSWTTLNTIGKVFHVFS